MCSRSAGTGMSSPLGGRVVALRRAGLRRGVRVLFAVGHLACGAERGGRRGVVAARHFLQALLA